MNQLGSDPRVAVRVLLALCVGLAACTATPARAARRAPAGRARDPEWAAGRPVVQAIVGATDYRRVAVEGVNVDGDEGELDRLPVIGTGMQWKLGGERVDLGLESLLSFSSRSEASAFAEEPGSSPFAVHADLLLFDLYGGPFASAFLGDHLRAYGALGPLVRYANYDQTGSGTAIDGSGMGLGFYARSGVELVLASGTMIGFALHWSDTRVDLGNELRDLEIDGLQALLTASSGL